MLSCDLFIVHYFPIDFLLTSSVAGIFNHRTRTLMHHFGLSRPEIETAVKVLQTLELDFMLHDTVPDNHRFRWRRFGPANADFDRRLALYAGHHEMLDPAVPLPSAGAQLLAISQASSAAQQHDLLRDRLPAHHVIRTTSPLDHKSTWFEIFPKSVGKAQAARWICETLSLDAGSALAIGNDFNDVDMLRWAPIARVVSNSPKALTDEFPTVADHQRGGFSEAVEAWLRQTV
ncbi:MAG: HAD hydrolase family protein, partial [Gammaproteobacteria bacterium]